MDRSAAIEKKVPAPTIHPRMFGLVLFIVFYGLGLVIASQSLNYYWFKDDLFTVRLYTIAEISAAFSGPFEPSGGSTYAYRPLSVVFYHLQSVLFGENVTFYRLFNIALLALDLVILMHIGLKLGMNRLQVALAGVLILCMRNTWYTLVWISIGVRPLNLFFVLVSAYLFLSFFDTRKLYAALLSLIYFSVALLLREEILFFLVLIPMFGLLYLWQTRPANAHFRVFLRSSLLKQLLLFAFCLACITLGFWVIRSVFVPESQGFHHLKGWLVLLSYVVLPLLPFVPIPAAVILTLSLWVFIGLRFIKLPRQQQILALFWLCCVVISCSMGVAILGSRADISFSGVMFLGLFLAVVLVNRQAPYRTAAVIAVVVLISGSFAASKYAQISIAPNNLRTISDNLGVLWEATQYYPLHIPDVRRAHIENFVKNYGLTPQNWKLRYTELVNEAIQAGRQLPQADHILFFSDYEWVNPR